MPYVDLKIPPGLYADGTERQSKGFWRDSNLVRGYGRSIGPVGGWRARTLSGASISGMVRAMMVWEANDGGRWNGLGSHTKAFAVDSAGAVTDITPAGFTTGRADASSTGGYGAGTYGSGVYGEPRLDTGTISPATMWDLDIWDQDLIGCSPDDGKIYYWDRNTANDFAVVTNAPTDCVGVVITRDKFMVAIKKRSIAWSDQGGRTVWTAAATNQAGDKDAQTAGVFRTGRTVSGATLIFSSADVWVLTYRRDIYVHDFLRAGQGCGIVSKGAAISLDTRCFWMSYKGFWEYNGGAVQPIDCRIGEKVFSDINTLQISKVHAVHLSRQQEIWWYYPSSGSTEIDRVAAWNYVTGEWWTHELVRTAGTGADGIFEQPLMIDSSGVIYDHEVGVDWDDAVPSARTGPLELGAGDQVMQCSWAVGDEHTQGDTSLAFYFKDQANADFTETSEYALTSTPTPVRFTGRQAEMEVRFGMHAGARFGDAKLDIQAGGRR